MAVFDCGKNPEWALDDHAPESWICDIINNILLVIYVLPPNWLTHIVKNRPVKNRGWTGTTQSHVSFSFTFALMGKKITAASIGCKYYSWSALRVGKKEVNKIKASCITFPLFSLCSTAHEEISLQKKNATQLSDRGSGASNIWPSQSTFELENGSGPSHKSGRFQKSG